MEESLSRFKMIRSCWYALLLNIGTLPKSITPLSKKNCLLLFYASQNFSMICSIKFFYYALIANQQNTFWKKMFKILVLNKYLHDGKPSLAFFISTYNL
ncbi:unnamed protein product [Linum tenue]|uniref:Uncharacterized protein n=1 Tax=Linum tenue TaxID=586396 RepID=A0AAV0PUK4_9ROSI|nr:unnamed protein product [Linum tenue]